MNTSTQNNPFVGLRPFNSDEGALFFGRQDQAVELMKKLHLTRFLGVVGSSGCGKSSLIRAGLIPKLRAGFLIGDRKEWRIAQMKPGGAPLRNLAVSMIDAATGALNPGSNVVLEETGIAALVESMRRAGAQGAIEYLTPKLDALKANLLLLVDQFEELFQFGIETGDPEKRDEAADFVSIILGLAEQRDLPVYVVITMRSDFLGECDNFYGLPETLNRSQYLVPRLTRRQRQQAIEGPVRLFDEKITPGLVDRVLNEVGDESDQLPVMQHALMRTWDEWRRTVDEAIDLPHYESAGKIECALSDDANNAIKDMSEDELKITERMFQALTKIDANHRRVRSRVRLSELITITGASREKILKIIDRFRTSGRSFLTIEDDKLSADPIVDISHESLIRQWKQLGDWLDVEAGWRDTYVRLAEDAARYEIDLDPGHLWRDPNLQSALDWYDKRKPNEAWARRYHPGFSAAKNFLNQSVAARDEERERERVLIAEEEARLKQDLETARKIKILNLLLLALCLIVGCLGVYAYVNKEHVEDTNNQLKDTNNQLNSARDLLLKQKGDLENTNRELEKKEKDLKNKNSELEKKENDLKNKNSELEKNRKDLQVQNLELVNTREKLEVKNKQLTATQIALNDNYENLKKALQIAETARRDAENSNEKLKEQYRLTDEQQSRLLAAFSGNLRRDNATDDLDLSALLAVHALRKADRKDSQPTNENGSAEDYMLTLAGHNAASPIPSLLALPESGDDKKFDGMIVPGSFSQDGKYLASFSRDGKYLAAFSNDGSVRVFDVKTGEVQAQTRRLGRDIDQVVFSQDGRSLATVENYKKRIRVWAAGKDQSGKPSMGQESGKPIELKYEITAIALSPDGKLVVTVGADKAQLWITDTGREKELEFNGKRIQNAVAAFSPDGKYVAIGRENLAQRGGQQHDNSVDVWNVEALRPAGQSIQLSSECACAVASLAFSRDGKYLAIGFEPSGSREDTRVQIWNLNTRQVIGRVTGTAPVFSDKEHYLAVFRGDKTIGVSTLDWSGGDKVNIGEPVRVIHDSRVMAVAFSEDEKNIAAINDKGTIRRWKTDNQTGAGAILLQRVADFAFNTNGDLLATADGKSIKILSSTTRQERDISVGETANQNEQIKDFKLSQDGKSLVTLTNKNIVRQWEIDASSDANKPRGKVILTPFDTPTEFTTVAVSPSGKYVVLKDKNNEVSVISADTSAIPQFDNLASQKVIAERFAFSQDETRFVTLAQEKQEYLGTSPSACLGNITWHAQMWDIADPAKIKKEGDKINLQICSGSRVTATALSPDGKYLVVGLDMDENAILIWEISGKQESFKGQFEKVERVKSIIFNQNNNYMMVVGPKANIWEMNWGNKSAKKVADLSIGADKFAFDKEGRYIVAASRDKVEIASWRPPDLADKICSRLSRNLTDEEWKEYFPDTPYAKTCHHLPVHQTYIDQAIKLAREGKEKEGDAIKIFERIKALQPDPGLDPAEEVKWYTSAKQADDKLIEISNLLSRLRAISKSSSGPQDADLKKAEELVDDAIKRYNQAYEIYSGNKSVFGKPDKLNKELIFPRRFSQTLNSFCWWSSLYGRASDVMSACQQSMEADRHNEGNRDSWGVAKALTAKSDKEREDAFNHFRAYINWEGEDLKPYITRRKCWIDDWEKRKINPFQDPKMKDALLKELRKEGLEEVDAQAGKCAYRNPLTP